MVTYHRDMQVLSEFCEIGTFSPLDWPDMGLLQTNDPVLGGMGVVGIHVLLLMVRRWDYGKALPEPARKQRLVVRNLSLTDSV